MARLVTLEEIKKVLEGFEKKKNPSRDGWTIKLFLEFLFIYWVKTY